MCRAGWLCGGMFGLPFYRHRLFATNWLWLAPGHPKHVGVIRPGPMFGNNGGRPTKGEADTRFSVGPCAIANTRWERLPDDTPSLPG